jgi:hypothetical protein
MNKKIAIIFSLMVLAIISVGAVSAGDNENVTVNSCDFNIPDDFTVENTTSSSAFLKNNDGEEIKIEVKDTINDKLSMVGDEATYGEHEGVLREYTNGMYKFFYLDDFKEITITTSDESLIESLFDFDDD